MTIRPPDQVADRAYLVTGATGWLGRATLEVLLQWLGPEVFVQAVDARSSSPRELMLSNGVRVRTGALEEPPRHESYVLVDLAFLTRDHAQAMGARTYLRANLTLVQRSLDLLERAQGVVLISSGAAVGDGGYPDWDAGLNPYGFAKNVQEQAVRAAAAGRVPVTVCRLWGAAGPDVVHPRKYAFSDFVLQALLEGSIHVRADHEVWRRYCDARQLMQACLRLNLAGRDITFDSGGALVEIRQLAGDIARAVHPDAPVFIEEPLGPPDRAFSESQRMEQLFAEMGMTPATLQELVQNTVDGLRHRVAAGIVL